MTNCQCWCDKNGIGEPGVTCGDCPRDYNKTWPWEPIDTAPRDGTEIVVWCDGVQDLPPLVSRCAWQPDAGFCVDELREPKYWIVQPNTRS